MRFFNKENSRNVLIIFCIAVIFAFIFIFSTMIFKRVFLDKNQDYIINGIAAFMGAFFSFLFVRLADVLNRTYERQKRAYDGLVKYEVIGNEYLSLLSDIEFVLDDIKQTAENSVKEQQALINFNTFDQVPIDNKLIFDLLNTELINEIFVLNTQLKKLNKSLLSLQKFYSEIITGYINKTFDFATFSQNMNILAQKMSETKKFTSANKKDVLHMVAVVRVLIRTQKPVLTKLLAPILYQVQLSASDRAEVDSEISVLSKEIQKNVSRSQSKIEEIVKS